jgi:hypothetical protein
VGRGRDKSSRDADDAADACAFTKAKIDSGTNGTTGVDDGAAIDSRTVAATSAAADGWTGGFSISALSVVKMCGNGDGGAAAAAADGNTIGDAEADVITVAVESNAVVLAADTLAAGSVGEDAGTRGVGIADAGAGGVGGRDVIAVYSAGNWVKLAAGGPVARGIAAEAAATTAATAAGSRVSIVVMSRGLVCVDAGIRCGADADDITGPTFPTCACITGLPVPEVASDAAGELGNGVVNNNGDAGDCDAAGPAGSAPVWPVGGGGTDRLSGTATGVGSTATTGADAVAEDAAAVAASGVLVVATVPTALGSDVGAGVGAGVGVGVGAGCELGGAVDTSVAAVVTSAGGIKAAALSVEAVSVWSSDAPTDMSKVNLPVNSPDWESATDARGSCQPTHVATRDRHEMKQRHA